jgi:hypothetical protein
VRQGRWCYNICLITSTKSPPKKHSFLPDSWLFPAEAVLTRWRSSESLCGASSANHWDPLYVCRSVKFLLSPHGFRSPRDPWPKLGATSSTRGWCYSVEGLRLLHLSFNVSTSASTVQFDASPNALAKGAEDAIHALQTTAECCNFIRMLIPYKCIFFSSMHSLWTQSV